MLKKGRYVHQDKNSGRLKEEMNASAT